MRAGDFVGAKIQPGRKLGVAPGWVIELSTIGRLMASLPSVEIDAASPRLFLSVPTGQYVPWFLANGALQAEPKIGRSPVVGDRVIVDLDSKLVDKNVVGTRDGGWEVTEGVSKKMGASSMRPPGIVLPHNTPTDRAPFQPNSTIVNHIKGARPELPRAWYAQQSFSPIVIIGDGREYLNAQRQEVLKKAPLWFDHDSGTLLGVEHGGVSSADHMLHFPYMVLAPEVASHSPWIADLAPRLVVYTRWSYYTRAAEFGLFSRAPAIIIGNRRVESNYAGLEFIDSAGCDPTSYQGISLPKPQSSMYLKAFSIQATQPNESDELDL